eukprot:g3020.t1
MKTGLKLKFKLPGSNASISKTITHNAGASLRNGQGSSSAPSSLPTSSQVPTVPVSLQPRINPHSNVKTGYSKSPERKKSSSFIKKTSVRIGNLLERQPTVVEEGWHVLGESLRDAESREEEASSFPWSGEWAQCQICSKWRKVISTIKAADLPETWQCSDSTWDKYHNKCEVPEDLDESSLIVPPKIEVGDLVEIASQDDVYQGEALLVAKVIKQRKTANSQKQAFLLEFRDLIVNTSSQRPQCWVRQRVEMPESTASSAEAEFDDEEDFAPLVSSETIGDVARESQVRIRPLPPPPKLAFRPAKYDQVEVFYEGAWWRADVKEWFRGGSRSHIDNYGTKKSLGKAMVSFRSSMMEDVKLDSGDLRPLYRLRLMKDAGQSHWIWEDITKPNSQAEFIMSLSTGATKMYQDVLEEEKLRNKRKKSKKRKQSSSLLDRDEFGTADSHLNFSTSDEESDEDADFLDEGYYTKKKRSSAVKSSRGSKIARRKRQRDGETGRNKKRKGAGAGGGSTKKSKKSRENKMSKRLRELMSRKITNLSAPSHALSTNTTFGSVLGQHQMMKGAGSTGSSTVLSSANFSQKNKNMLDNKLIRGGTSKTKGGVHGGTMGTGTGSSMLSKGKNVANNARGTSSTQSILSQLQKKKNAGTLGLPSFMR